MRNTKWKKIRTEERRRGEGEKNKHLTTSSADNDDDNEKHVFIYCNYVERRERRDVDDAVVVEVGSGRHTETNVGSRRQRKTNMRNPNWTKTRWKREDA